MMLRTLILPELYIFQKKQKHSNKNIKTNTFRMQAYGSIMIGYFCIGFIDSFFPGKTESTSFFSPNKFKRNDDIILRYFMTKRLKNGR